MTPQELAVLRAGDAVIDQETPAEKNARQSAESRERRRARMGDAAYAEMVRERARRWHALKAGRGGR